MSRSVYRRDGGWRLRWAILVAGDLLAACLAYLLAFVLRTHVPLPLTQGYLPGVRFAEVHHHWIEMFVAQVAVLQSADRGMIKSSIRASPGKASAFDAAASV